MLFSLKVLQKGGFMLYWTVRYLLILFFKVFCKIKYIDAENIPKKGGFILASNHVSYYDPFAVGTPVVNKVHFMAKKELFEEPLMGWVITKLGAFPVDREKSDLRAIKTALEILKSGEVVGIFPEGTRSKDGEVHDAQRGTATISIMAKVPVVPAAVVGTKDAMMSKFPPKWKRIMVKYGKPIYPEDFKGSKKERIEKMTHAIIDSIRDMKKELENIWEP